MLFKSLSCVRLFVTPQTAACQASLSFTNSGSLLKLMSIELVMPSNHLLYHPLLLLPSIFPSITIFSNESALSDNYTKFNFFKKKGNVKIIWVCQRYIDFAIFLFFRKKLLSGHRVNWVILWQENPNFNLTLLYITQMVIHSDGSVCLSLTKLSKAFLNIC